MTIDDKLEPKKPSLKKGLTTLGIGLAALTVSASMERGMLDNLLAAAGGIVGYKGGCGLRDYAKYYLK
ncbi:MAG TPA: hypothetical protein VJC21_04235 [Candidatus Nanoarchaeia archaeon]|nr:hypothetical protein [Candidatus Nanoarchaeia archaeon]